MILKIKGISGNWWLEDNIAKINHGHEGRVRLVDDGNSSFSYEIRNEDSDDYVEFYPDLVMLDYNEVKCSPVDVKWACIRFRNNEEKFIVYGTAYILNDEGKTIERI